MHFRATHETHSVQYVVPFPIAIRDGLSSHFGLTQAYALAMQVHRPGFPWKQHRLCGVRRQSLSF